MATGWGRSTWGADVFGGTSVNVSVTGNVGTLSLGSETVVATANVAVTNVVGTSALDDGTAVQAAAVTGVSAVASASALGDESVTAAANVTVTGNVGTSALGTESLITNNFLDMTGLAGTSALGTVTPKANADIVITEGFELTSALNTVNVWGQVGQGVSTTYTAVSTTQTPNWEEVA